MLTLLLIIVFYLYIAGLTGLHATARDLNEGPIRTRRAWAGLILWPVVIPLAKIADLYEWLYEDAASHDHKL